MLQTIQTLGRISNGASQSRIGKLDAFLATKRFNSLMCIIYYKATKFGDKRGVLLWKHCKIKLVVFFSLVLYIECSELAGQYPRPMGLFYKELDNELPSQGPLRTALDNSIQFHNSESVVHDAVQILTLPLVPIFQE